MSEKYYGALIRRKIPCVVPPYDPMHNLRKMLENHTGCRIHHMERRSGRWLALTPAGWMPTSDLIKQAAVFGVSKHSPTC